MATRIDRHDPDQQVEICRGDIEVPEADDARTALLFAGFDNITVSQLIAPRAIDAVKASARLLAELDLDSVALYYTLAVSSNVKPITKVQFVAYGQKKPVRASPDLSTVG